MQLQIEAKYSSRNSVIAVNDNKILLEVVE